MAAPSPPGLRVPAVWSHSASPRGPPEPAPEVLPQRGCWLGEAVSVHHPLLVFPFSRVDGDANPRWSAPWRQQALMRFQEFQGCGLKTSREGSAPLLPGPGSALTEGDRVSVRPVAPERLRPEHLSFLVAMLGGLNCRRSSGIEVKLCGSGAVWQH